MGCRSLARSPGLDAAGFEPVRLGHPWHHPRYGPKQTAEQSRFQAYLGVPIIRLRKVLGVLEVQREADRQFDEEDASLLLTLSLQLAGMIESAEPIRMPRREMQGIYFGTAAAPGAATGEGVCTIRGCRPRHRTESGGYGRRSGSPRFSRRIERRSGQPTGFVI